MVDETLVHRRREMQSHFDSELALAQQNLQRAPRLRLVKESEHGAVAATAPGEMPLKQRQFDPVGQKGGEFSHGARTTDRELLYSALLY